MEIPQHMLDQMQSLVVENSVLRANRALEATRGDRTLAFELMAEELGKAGDEFTPEAAIGIIVSLALHIVELNAFNNTLKGLNE